LGKAAQSPGRIKGLALVLDQHRLAVEHDDELVLLDVPVALAGYAAGLEHDMGDPEIAEARGGRETAVVTLVHQRIVGRRIAGAVDLLDRVEVQLGHSRLHVPPKPVRAEPVEALPFPGRSRGREGMPFDRLRANGVGVSVVKFL
jgi:hypothetical protein